MLTFGRYSLKLVNKFCFISIEKFSNFRCCYYLGNVMTIDMSSNSIYNYTNQVPIYVNQFSETPDPRNFYLNDNQLERLSDLLLEQYGACTTLSTISTAYFVVGISNVLLTNNPLICDCESYHLLSYINNNINDFPEINNGSLLNQATCKSPSSMVGKQFLFTNFSVFNECIGYILPNITDRFCSVYTNETSLTLAPPTYWTTLTTTSTTTTNVNDTTTDSSGGTGGTNVS